RRAKVWGAGAVAGGTLTLVVGMAMTGGGHPGQSSPTHVVTPQPSSHPLALAPGASPSPAAAPVAFTPVRSGKQWVVRRYGVAAAAAPAAHSHPSGGGGWVPPPSGGPSSGSPSPSTTAPRTTSTTAPPSTSTTAPPTTSTTAAPASTLNSLARIDYCMDGPHEGLLHGVPPSWSWGSHPTVGNATNGADAAITSWGQVYADVNATEPSSGVRVELKNMETYVWSLSQRRWLRVQATVQVSGDHYVEDFANNASIAADWQTEPDGGISSSMVGGYNLHFWPTGSRGSVAPSDIGAVYTTYQARLIGPNAAAARYLANVGGDWWLNTTVGYGDGTNNPGIGQGRFVYLSTNWNSVDFYTGGAYGTG